MARTFEELPGWAREMLERAPVARLGLVDPDGAPRVLPITFVAVGETIWTAVDHKPKRCHDRELARVRWLRERPDAALTVDAYDDDWSRLAWVQTLGRVEVHGAAADGVHAALAAKYQQYAERAPDGPFLALAPTRFLHWRAAGDE